MTAERVLLMQLDGQLPFVSLMQIAAHHLAKGDHVELRKAKSALTIEPRFEDMTGDGNAIAWDRVYASCIFQSTRPLAERLQHAWHGVNLQIGGTGWVGSATLASVGIDPDGPLDYSVYPTFKPSLGFTQRGCRLACEFCVVPAKEGKVRDVATIEQIWRGGDHPREIILLDNDFFGGGQWRERIRELREGKFAVSFCQGINARMLNDETAEAIASVDYRDISMGRRPDGTKGKDKRKRIYTAWDSRKDERTLFRGLEALARAGVKPDHIMVYMLIGYWPGETHADRDYRRKKLRDFGARPYPMPFTRTGPLGDELKRFQKWVVQRADLFKTWEEWCAARGELRRLGDRRVSLPLFPGSQVALDAVAEPDDHDDGDGEP